MIESVESAETKTVAVESVKTVETASNVDENQNPEKSIVSGDESSSSSRSEVVSEPTEDEAMDVAETSDAGCGSPAPRGTPNANGGTPPATAVLASNVTPLVKFSENGGITPTQLTPTSASKKRKRLTPDERLVREKERTEKRLKLEEEKQRKEEDKRRKEQERLDKLKVKEQERIERERQREQERLKREEVKEQERLKREEDIAKKAEEKRKKEEDRLKKEEEKRVKEEERKKMVDEKEKERLKLEDKKAKQAQNFTSFFQKSPSTVNKIRTLGGVEGLTARQKPTDTESDKEKKLFVSESEVKYDPEADLQVILVKKLEAAFFDPMPFQIKTYMSVAPVIRRIGLTPIERTILDKYFEPMENSPNKSTTCGNAVEIKSDFLDSLKSREPRRSGRTKDGSEADLDNPVLIEVEDIQRNRQHRWKLIQFHDNRRPAYWGTWIRKPLKISGRCPFARETDLDYEFDSDDEWEDEPEDAEEIENSDGEEEPQDAEGEPVDEDDEEGWMVPHGYLSDTEREGGEMDLETIKNKEKEFFRSLKEQVKMGLPVIQTESLSEFRMVFAPSIHSLIRKSQRKPKPASQESMGPSRGFLALDLPSDDEEDREWDETSSNDGDSEGDSEESSSDSDDEDSFGDDECEVMESEIVKRKDHSIKDNQEDESMEDEESVALDTNA